jgi:hypothetical protein
LAEVAHLLVTVIDILDVELREVEKRGHGIRSGPWLEEPESLGLELRKLLQRDIKAGSSASCNDSELVGQENNV